MKRNTKSQVTLDGFVVRSSKVSPSSSPIKELGMRQATLESLKGVVVVEEMERARVVLERNDVSTELKVDTLQHLLRKTPAKEVLIKTKLGKTVHKLCRAEEGEVAAAAQQVYTSWKNHILSKVNRPYIEVKCDLKTQKLRSSAKQMLLEALQREIEGGGVEHESSREDEVLERKEIKQNTHKHVHKDEGNSVGKSASKRPRDDCTLEKPVHKSKQSIEEEEGKSEDRGNHKRSKEDRHTKKYKHKHNLKEDEEEGKNGDRGDYKRLKQNSHTEKYEQKHRKNHEEGRSGDRGEQREARGTQDTQQDSVDTIADHLEREVYQVYTRRVDNRYRRTIRSMIFALRHQRDVRKAVVLATLSVEDFVSQHMKT